MDLINLRRLSAIIIVSKIWEKEETKRKIRELFIEKLGKEIENQGQPERKNLFIQSRRTEFKMKDPIEDKYYSETEEQGLYNEFLKIINSSKQYLNLIEVPQHLKDYCQDVTAEIGEKIYDWIVYVTIYLRLDFKYSEKIYWSPYGTIDESKIFQTWKNDEKFPNEEISQATTSTQTSYFLNIPRNLDSEIPPLYILACINVQEDFITNNQDKMEKFLRIHYPKLNFDNYDNKVYTLMALYLNLYIVSTSVVLDKNFNNSGYVITPDIMLTKCASACFNKAVYYFWEITKEFGCYQYISEISKSCLRKLNEFNRAKITNSDGDNNRKDKLAEIAVFLINQIKEQNRSQFLHENALDYINAFLPLWPFNEMILELVEKFPLDLSVSDYENIFLHIQQLLEKNSGEKIQIFHKIFQKIFTSLSKNTKEEVFKNSFLHQYFKSFDLKCFNFVLKNMDENYRAKAIENIRPRILILAQEGKMEELNHFLREILISDDEREVYKECITDTCLDKCVRLMNFQIVEKLLDYFSSSDEESEVLKNKINSLEICNYFIIKQSRYDKGEKFLEWMFPNEDDRENFRNSLDPGYFIYERTSKLWDNLIRSAAKSDSDYRSDYFRLFFGSPEELKFVKIEQEEDFYTKRELSGNLFIEVYGKNNRVRAQDLFYDKFELFDLYMKWACKDVQKRNDIRRNYRNESERELFCKLVQSLLNFTPRKAFNSKNIQNSLLYKNPFT